jgi:hypothetical protein
MLYNPVIEFPTTAHFRRKVDVTGILIDLIATYDVRVITAGQHVDFIHKALRFSDTIFGNLFYRDFGLGAVLCG